MKANKNSILFLVLGRFNLFIYLFLFVFANHVKYVIHLYIRGYCTEARSLGVVFDSELRMRAHVSNICRAGWSFIYRIGKIRSYLDEPATLKLIHAFVTSRIDSCNSLLIGLPTNEINRLQRLQNAAARLVCRVKRHEHITPILQSLHWLPVSQRIIYKSLILTFKALHNLAPP